MMDNEKFLLFLTAMAIAALIGIAYYISVGSAPEKTEPTTNKTFNVDTLFKKDGCTMYRFSDGGRSHYFVRCANAAETISQQNRYCGKPIKERHIMAIRV